MKRFGNYEIHGDYLYKFNWGRGHNWQYIRRLTFWERIYTSLGFNIRENR